MRQFRTLPSLQSLLWYATHLYASVSWVFHILFLIGLVVYIVALIRRRVSRVFSHLADLDLRALSCPLVDRQQGFHLPVSAIYPALALLLAFAVLFCSKSTGSLNSSPAPGALAGPAHLLAGLMGPALVARPWRTVWRCTPAHRTGRTGRPTTSSALSTGWPVPTNRCWWAWFGRIEPGRAAVSLLCAARCVRYGSDSLD